VKGRKGKERREEVRENTNVISISALETVNKGEVSTVPAPFKIEEGEKKGGKEGGNRRTTGPKETTTARPYLSGWKKQKKRISQEGRSME